MDLTRRSLLGGFAIVTAAASAVARKAAGAKAGSMFTYAAPKLDRVRCGIIGVGERGTPMTKLLLDIDGVDIKAICDIDEFVLDRAIATSQPIKAHWSARKLTRWSPKSPPASDGDLEVAERLVLA